MSNIIEYIENNIPEVNDSINADTTKFHVGDWITNDRYVKMVVGIGTKGDIPYYYMFKDGTTKYIDEIDKKYHLWTIQDAKDGDILAFDDNTIVMFKDLYNTTAFHSYCHIKDGVFTISDDDLSDWCEGKGFYPANKKQRQFFFQKMKEAEKTKEDEYDINKFTDKDNIKFNVGDWITNGEHIYKIIRVFENKYCVLDCFGFHNQITIKNYYHIWTPTDIRIGSILKSDTYTFIVKDFNINNSDVKTYCMLNSANNSFNINSLFTYKDDIRPATSGERTQLFKKMDKLGYKWDYEIKKLKKWNFEKNEFDIVL